MNQREFSDIGRERLTPSTTSKSQHPHLLRDMVRAWEEFAVYGLFPIESGGERFGGVTAYVIVL